MVRAFIAVPIPQQAEDALAATINTLRQKNIPAIKWVRPEGIHLTLKFLGEVDLDRIETILGAMSRACEGTGSLQLALSELGAFPSRAVPRVLWVGLKGDLDRLRELHRRVDAEVRDAIGLPLEARDFAPHLTLGRVRENASSADRRAVATAIEAVAPEGEVEWEATEVRLIRSTLTREGAVYDVLGSRVL